MNHKAKCFQNKTKYAKPYIYKQKLIGQTEKGSKICLAFLKLEDAFDNIPKEVV